MKKKVVLRMGAPVDVTDVNVMAHTHAAKYLCMSNFAATQAWEYLCVREIETICFY